MQSIDNILMMFVLLISQHDEVIFLPEKVTGWKVTLNLRTQKKKTDRHLKQYLNPSLTQLKTQRYCLILFSILRPNKGMNMSRRDERLMYLRHSCI